MVLASLLILSAVAVEFAYNAHVAYAVAATQRDRTRAFYLARSAVNLIRLELKSEAELRQNFAGVLSQLASAGAGTDVPTGPFCKMFPLSSGLVEGIASGGIVSEGESPSDEGEEEGAEGTEEKEEKGEVVGEDLLKLGGEFEGSCDTEEGKISLNAFFIPRIGEESGASATSTVYENQKGLFVSLLGQPDFEKIFEGKRDEVQRIVGRIADWADTDDRINEAPGLSGGYEDSEYGELPYKPKNGKFTSPSELLLIPGIGDEIYRLLYPHITVFGDQRINLCTADEGTARAFLISYSQSTPGAARLDPEDQGRMETLLELIRNACSQPNPQPEQIASAIASVIGGDVGRSTPQRRGGVTAGAGSSGGTGLAGRISTTTRFYRVEGVGHVGEVEVRIHQVLDTGGGTPNLWKTLYYRVD